MNPPLVSVILPTHNRAHVIERALNSIMCQSFQDFECIVVDDGSKDETRYLMHRLMRERVGGEKIRYHEHERNQGPSAARNTGVSLARGTFVAFLDSDDEWTPNMLEDQLQQFVDDPQIKCSYTWMGYFDKRNHLVPGKKFSIRGYMYKEALSQGYVCGPVTLMLYRECFVQVGGFNNQFINCEDDDLCMRLAKNFKFGLVPAVRAIIHVDSGNQTTANRVEYADAWFRFFCKYQDEVIKYCGPKVMAAHFVKCARLSLQVGDLPQAKKIAKLSISLNRDLNAYAILVLAALPSPAGKSISVFTNRVQGKLLRLIQK